MAQKKKRPSGKTIQNRRASFDYQLGESLVVGLELNGREAKALRLGHGQLRGAYVTIKGDELWLINATINGTNGIPIRAEDQTRTRKLLAKRREINALIAAKQQGSTIIPLEILTRGRFIKLRLATGKGRRTYDKREELKRRDENRRIQQAMAAARP
ncbi:MAG TPA: SsrA-binding protein SmpB [Candidatus Saccharimonadales bacterium]|nr:SsrA-binding protein SmpB [Candidatus Saccharimonadales bacterium]